MSIEYIASIAEADYKLFRIIITTDIPRDYETWLRVRERGKLRALTERGASVSEIEVSLLEFAAYCKGLKRPDFSIVSLDRYAREKAIAKWEQVTTSPSGAVAQSAVAA
jgi:hypothetical protein